MHGIIILEFFRDCSYSFQGSVKLICITVTVSFRFLQNAVTENNSSQDFLEFTAITVTVATQIRVKLIPPKYLFASAFVLILIGQMIFRINVHIDTSPRI